MSNTPSRRPLPPEPLRSPSTAIHDAIRTTLPTTPPANSGPEASSAGPNSASRQQQGCISQGARNMRQRAGFEQLPEDILHCIHSLLTVQDAARVACVSRGFLRAWRCYSHLILNVHTLGLADKTIEEQETYIIQKVDQILENHHKNGVKVETLKLILASYRNIKASSLDRWLQITAKSGIKELDLSMPLRVRGEYNFMCAVLSDEAAASSIQSLRLYNCAFHPTSSLGLLRRLTCLHLCIVHVTEEVLGILLSKSSALEKLDISFCRGIICLRIDCALQHLKYIRLIHCIGLQSVQINAPNLCSFHSDGIGILTAVRNSPQLKNVDLTSILLSDARVRLPSIIRNVQSLSLHSCYGENANITIPMLPSKFPHLKKLEIILHQQAAILFLDIFSLVSFLDAAPVLDSFILRVENGASTPDLISGDNYEYSRRELEYRYDCLRQVLITGFYPSKSLVELTIHILESAPFLKRLTLDTTDGSDRRFVTVDRCPASTKNGQYRPMCKTDVVAARRAVEVAGRCITRRVPRHVQFEVLEPCSHCHNVDP